MLTEAIKRYRFHLVVIGDILIFVLSMAIVLTRYGYENYSSQFYAHIGPFGIVLILWLIIFYIFNLYTYKAFGNIMEITRKLSIALITSFSITVIIFYVFGRFFELTPKANLVFLVLVFGILDLAWRYILRKIFIHKAHRLNVLILAESPLVQEIIDHTNANPQLGYFIESFGFKKTELKEYSKNKFVNIIVVDGHSLKNKNVSSTLYNLLPEEIEVLTLIEFYEKIFNCIPPSEVEAEWFIREIAKNKSFYEGTKHLLELIFVIVTAPFFILISILIAILIAITSPGPVIYKQERIGKNGRPFMLYKFRTMKTDHSGPLWTTEKDDRVILFGRLLRHIHFDEIPQLFNILRGDISFVGPRPERTELVNNYKQIPHYEIRHIIKPGIIGWAQLNYKASTSLEEAEKKFQFDLYYLKNRSFILDIFIILKTVRTIF
ncbi:MAG TPA: exopolysaccharide biosynthesis polyprenyl glycosylphosphotransferase [Candidatus Paceibacterota bacterium]|nr:exopolysaccharide biosynthesis polyprenyl glycosylphosphotransferase [Candidatus Paceibacterota bacterium]